ncbi:MAG: hypothetical protein E7490_05830 [Ruminococcaceae bacterium]|nr:hypothetical protein [Oscillospiraceae bacterium]
MKYKKLRRLGNSVIYQTRFSGINNLNGTPLGEWEEMHNMTSDSYPAVRNMPCRRYKSLPIDMTGFMFKDDMLVYTVSDGIYIGDTKIDLELTETRKKLVSMGAYIVILPDWIVINTEDMTNIDSLRVTITGGTLYEKNINQTSPTIDIRKLMYYETDSSNLSLSLLQVGDRVTLEYAYKNRAYSIRAYITAISDDEDYLPEGKTAIIFDTTGDLYQSTRYFYTEQRDMTGGRTVAKHMNVTLERSAEVQRLMIPKMDYDLVIEHNNRLWGCSSENHEIYCSKLGDPFVWKEYNGISTDSYAVTVGSDGDFTGSAVYNDSILFFKENCVHSIYGTKPSNFTLSTTELRGVQKGSHNSICKSNGLLYYKAPEGIFVFNGSTSVRADARLGRDITDTAVGVADDNAVYMATDYRVYVYDCLHDSWHTEDIMGGYGTMISGHNYGGALYLTMVIGNFVRLYLMRGNDDSITEFEEDVSFGLVTGDLNRTGAIMRHISKLRFVIGVDDKYRDVSFSISISYNGGEYKTVYSYDSTKTKPNTEIFTVPIIPMRCQRMKIRIGGRVTENGYGNTPAFTLYGIYYNTEGGTELG